MSKIDFDQINDHALSALDSLVHEWFPNGHREGHEYKIGSLSGEPGRSLSINLRTGAWKDFASDAGGSDPISLLAAIRGGSMADAARELGDRLRTGISSAGVTAPRKPDDRDEWSQISPVPSTASSPIFRHYKFGEPSRKWEYRDANGGLIGYVCRFDLADGGKDVVPICYCRHSDGRTEWRWKSFSKPRPLYGLDLLAANPSAGVLIVEGEKAADAARSIAPKSAVVVTWPGGSKAIRHVDWSPLAGRKLLIWPDRDEAGRTAASDIAGRVHDMSVSVRIIDPPRGDEDGWDLADAVADGWDRARLVAWLKPRPAQIEDEPIPEPPPGWDAPSIHYEPEPDIAPEPVRWQRHSDRISDLPFRLLGVDGDQFLYMPDRGLQVVSLTASSHTKPNLMRLAPLQCWEQDFSKDGGGINWDAAVNALIQQSMKLPKFDPRRVRGRGCWIDGEDVVFHAGDQLYVNGDPCPIPEYQSSVRAIYEGALEIPVELDHKASNREAADLSDLCQKLSWERPLYGKLLAGWIALAPVCGALGWRPHVWVTGAAGSGKSWLIGNIVQPCVGSTALNVQGDTTESGIRQTLGSDALPVIFDEAESEDKSSGQRLEKVLQLARQASTETGAGIVKGSANGGAVTYLIRSCFLFSSIGVAAVKKPDVSRITTLTLKVNDSPTAKEDFARIEKMCRETVYQPDYCARLRARSLKNAKTIRANVLIFTSVAVEFTGDKRSADQIGTLLAGAYSLTSEKEVSKEFAREWMSKQDWSGFRSEAIDNDEHQCLAHLMAAVLRIEIHGAPMTRSVDELIREIADMHPTNLYDDAAKRKKELLGALCRHGLKYDDGLLYVANRHQQLERVFADTQWAGSKWRGALERVKGAERVETMAFGTHVRQRAVMVPIGFGD